MIELNIQRGLSTVLFSEPGVINPRLVIEEGCWYLCTDTAELFLGVQLEGGLTLKRINENADQGESIDPEVLETLRVEVNAVKESLKDYAKKSDLPDVSKFITEIPAEYVTKTELNNKGFLTEHQDLSDYAKKTDVPSIEGLASETFVLTKIAEAELSDKEVDLTGYATKEDIKGLASEQFVADAIATIEIPEQDLSNYYNKTETENIVNEAVNNIKHPTTDLTGYATEKYVDDAIAEINIPDVSNFITMEDVETKGYLTQVPSEYITEEELNTKGFITDISGKAEADHKHSITEIEGYIEPDLSDYAKKSDIPDVTGFIREIPAEYVTENELTAKGYLTKHQDLSEYAKKTDLPSVDGLASEEFVRQAIEDIEIPEADLSKYSTTEQMAAAINTAVVVKANNILFTTDKFVTSQIGSFVNGESVKDLTIAELFAKLLGLSDNPAQSPDDFDQPEYTPEQPTTVAEKIIADKLMMYSVNMDNELAAADFKVLTLTPEEAAAAPQVSGFYQINDNGEIIESGYQELQIMSDETYYIIALPKIVDYESMVELQAYDSDENIWYTCDKLPLTSDQDTVVALCDEAGVDISHIDTDIYTVLALEDTCTGSKLRYIIKEVN